MAKIIDTTDISAGGFGDLEPLIRAIKEKAGVPGVAVGVIHDGKIVHESYHGYRDVEASLAPDRDTLFYVASLTKAMTATALGILVDRGQLDWSTPVHDILPEMSRDTEIYTAKLSVLDVLSHRSGKGWADALYLESNNRILLPKSEAIRTFDYLPQITPVRSEYMYNNHAYNIAGLVIEKVSGMPWKEFMSKNLFEPLGMTRTFTKHPEDENVAAPYNVLTDRTPWRLPFCNVSNETLMFAGQSVRTSMGDLLKYASAYLQALETAMPKTMATLPISQLAAIGSQSCASKESSRITARNPIREINTIIRPRISRPVDALLEQTYALGWNRTQLPGSLDFGWNNELLQPFPLLGEDYPGKLAIWHGGNMPGTTSAICLLPESQTAVIVLQNSLGLCDIADWICQASVDILMLGRPAKDYVSHVSTCVDQGLLRMAKVEEQLDKERIAGTKPRALQTFVGRYYNRIKNWFIDISTMENRLYLEFLGREDERYMMCHYHHDTFTWNMSYDEMVKRGQYIRSYKYYRIEFEQSGDGPEIWQLRWRHDRTVPDGEVFRKNW